MIANCNLLFNSILQKLKNRTADITRGTVQKSVCVLSTLPLYGHIQVKMALITHAYFDEGDFSKVQLLHDTYYHLNSCLAETDFLHSATPQLYVGEWILMHLSCSEVFWSDHLCWCGIKPLMTKLHDQLTFFLIWKAQGSDFGPLTAHPDWDISCFYLISPGICQGSTSNWTTAFSCHIISPLLFTARINLSNKGSQWNQVVNYSTKPNSLLYHVGVTGCRHSSGGCGLSFNLNRVLKSLDLFKVFVSSFLHWNKICNDRCYTYSIFDFLLVMNSPTLI